KARTAIPGEFERHALPDLALRRGIEQEGHIAVRMQVDKARRNDLPASIDSVLGCPFEVPNGHDVPLADRHVGPIWRTPCAVNNQPISDEQVVHSSYLPVTVGSYTVYWLRCCFQQALDELRRCWGGPITIP